MDLKQEHGKPKNRFLKLSLKKNRVKADYETKELNRSFDIMIIDESFDRLISEHQKTVSLKPKIYSTIVIDDSFNTTNEDDIMMNKEPSKYGNVSTSSIRDLTSPSNNNDNRPSRGGWSPGQNILCATPRTKPAPATPKDVANESFEKCSIKTIQKSHHKLLNDLYGESWQSIPSLFKSIQRRRECHNEISKKLQFEDGESDKENIGQASEKHTELFLTESDLKNKTGIFSDIETKSKKTLYTEKVPIIQEPPEQKPLKGRKKVVKTTSTPELPKQKSIKYNRDVKTTGKKRKDMTVRELVNTLLNDVDCITEKVQSVTPKTQQRCESHNEISKKLQFEDFDSDKNENIRQVMEKNKELYLTGSDLKNKKGNFGDIERKSKKKLYTEKIPNTPEPPQQKPLRSYRDVKATSTPELPKHNSIKHNRDVKTTGKKCKVKTVTELVKTLQDDVDGLTKRVQSVTVSPKTGDVVKRLGFIGSLADNVPSWRCHPEALQYHEQYRTLKEQLARRLYVEFNKVVFDDRLEADMCITWDAKLRSTAGMTINRSIKTSRGDKLRTSSIKLSVKVVDTAQRLRDTLVHEMCHAATWLIDAQLRAGHGPLWKKWTLKALRHFPELGEIARCHDLAIHYKYCYKCTQCGYSIKRHSKSIDITKKCCGCCRGKFEILINKKNKDGVVVSTPVRQAGPSGFALYVKEHYGALKSGRSHGEVMRMLGEQYSAKKPQNLERIGSDDSVDDLCSD